MTTITVAAFNATGGSNRTDVGRFGTWYDDLECDVAIVSEVFRFANVLRHCGHLRVGSDNHGREDCGVITRRKVKRWSQRRVTRFINRPGSDKPLLWHDRWLTRVVAGPRWDRIVAVSSHAPAVIQNRATGRPLDNPGANEWRDYGAPATERCLRRDMAGGRPLAHGGDLNQRECDDKKHHDCGCPAEMYRRLGMEYVTHEVMWCAWNPRRFELVRWDVLPTPPGSDGHPVLLVTLRRIPRRRRKEK